MIFTTPTTPEEEKIMHDYMEKNPYGPVPKLSNQDIQDSLDELKKVKAMKSNTVTL